MKPYILQENRWRIAADGSRSYMLQKAGMEKGELRWRNEGYFVSLEDCLKAYLHRQVLESDKDLPDALEESIRALQVAVGQLQVSLTVNF